MAPGIGGVFRNSFALIPQVRSLVGLAAHSGANIAYQ
jgi:hypothetical protein